MTATAHMQIPSPPSEILDPLTERFIPSEVLRNWVTDTFISDDASLHNPQHFHLQSADMGFLWTNVENVKKGRLIIATAEAGNPQGAMGKWARSKAVMQVTEWFRDVPDFIITIYAPWWDQASNINRCALIEHELFHCAQDKDEFGQPKFNKSTGRPSFAIRGHDLEEFIGVVKRYGAVSDDVRELVDAANQKPQVSDADINRLCGTCAR